MPEHHCTKTSDSERVHVNTAFSRHIERLLDECEEDGRGEIANAVRAMYEDAYDRIYNSRVR